MSAGNEQRPVVVNLLGTPELRLDGRSVITPERTFPLLGYLAFAPNGSTKRAAVAQLFWDEAIPERANGNLRQFVARLRKFQSDNGFEFINIDDENFVLDSSIEFDVHQFSQRNLQRLLHEHDAPKLKQLCELYRGDLLANTGSVSSAYSDWLNAQRSNLRESLLKTSGEALDNSNFFASIEDRLSVASRIFEIDATHEPACRSLMTINLSRGDRAAALRCFTRCETALAQELDLKPEQRTIDIAKELRGNSAPEVTVRVETPPDEPKVSARLGNPRVAILPPVSLQTNDELAQLCAVLIEDVTVKLGRYRSFTVIAAHTATMLAGITASSGSSVQGKADFIVNTSVRPSTGGWSMTFRLTEVATGVVLWVSEIAWRPEMLGQIFDLLISRVVGSLVDAIERSSLKTPASAPDVTAYRLYLEGQRSLKSIELQDLRRARKWFRDATNQTSTYAAPLVGMSRSLFMEWLVRGMKDPGMLTESASFAGKALDLDPFDWRALRERGLSSLYMRRHDESLEFFERAILLGPNDADLLADYADALAFSGDPEKGLQMCQRAIELNPIVPGYYTWILGSILYQQHRYGEALSALEPVKNNDATSRLMAACSARAGRMEDAKRYADKVREVFPGLKAEHVREISPNRRKEDMDHLIEGIRMAGVD